jgi:hypothetical protein
MEEVIEALRERSQAVAVPLELPSEDDVLDVEAELYFSLDHDFREFLLTASDIICGSLEPVTAADPASHTYLPEVAAQAWDSGLPRDLAPLCQVDHDYYCVNEEGVVHFWQDGALSETCWDSVWHWAEEVWLTS